MASKFKIEVIKVGEWERAGKYVMGRWQIERHTDSKRHTTKTHRVYRTKNFKPQFKAMQQLQRIAQQREARNGKDAKEDSLVKQDVDARDTVSNPTSEHGDRRVDIRGNE